MNMNMYVYRVAEKQDSGEAPASRERTIQMGARGSQRPFPPPYLASVQLRYTLA